MYTPFGFLGAQTLGVPLDNIVTWLTPTSYNGSGNIWVDVTGNGVNGIISGSLTSAGPDGWTFTSGTYLDFGTASYTSPNNEPQQTIITYGTLNDNNAVQTIWSKGSSDQWWWVPFTGSFVCSDAPSGNWTGSRFDISYNGGQFFTCNTTPVTPSTGFTNVQPVDYNPALSVGKQMYTTTNAGFNATPSSIAGPSLYINENRIYQSPFGFGEGLNNNFPMYFGKGDSWPNINQPTISDILIYKRALTPEEISSIYNYFLIR
jgi:hypothetical protein